MLLRVENIAQSFTYTHFLRRTTKEILNNISFCINEGENVALLGPSGCGKSTLAKIIAHLQKPKSGKIFLHEKEVKLHNLAQKHAFYKEVQILFQDPISSLNPRYNVFENLKEPLQYLLNMHDTKSQEKAIFEVIAELELPRELLFSYPQMLSGGQAQRVCAARMLLVKPRCAILDETTSGLDSTLQEKLWNLFIAMQKKYGTTFLFITHDIVLARKYCDTLMLMDKGSIVEMKPCNEDFTSPLGREFMACTPHFLPC